MRAPRILGLTSAAIVLVTLLVVSPISSADEAGSISANFNGTAIAGGSYLWFSSVVKPSGLPGHAVTVYVRNATIQFTASGTPYTVIVPNANVTFDPAATSATTTYSTTDNAWHTTVPASGLAGNTFLSAAAYLVPAPGLPGGIQGVTWQASFSIDTTGVSLQWKWAAAAYTAFSADYTSIGVKPVDDN